jgi:NDP-sugar pyrophosphorylase family protein
VLKNNPSGKMANSIQLIIPMSGIGKRFMDAGYTDPKPLINVDGFPMIRHVMALFPGTTDVHFICNEVHLQMSDMREALVRVCPTAVIHSVPTEGRMGPVHAVMQIADSIEDGRETIVSYCDYGSSWDYLAFLTSVRSRDADGAIVCYTGFHPHMLGSDNYAFVKMNGDRAEAVQEKKPFTDIRMNELASNGTYYFKNARLLKKYFNQTLSEGPIVNNEYYCSVVYNHLIKDGLLVSTYIIDQMLQWGTPYDLEIYKGWSNYFLNIIHKQPEVGLDLETVTILPMAGHGSRFSDKGYREPKPFLLVNDSPMFIQAVKCLPPTRENVFICLQAHLDQYNLENDLKKHLKQYKVVSIDETTQGQACTCEAGIDAAFIDPDRPIMISACDNGVYYDTAKYAALKSDPDIDVIVWSFRNNQTSKLNPNMYSWLDVDDDQNILAVHCKQFVFDDPLNTHAIIGTMYFRKARYFMDGLMLNYQKNLRTNGEFYVDDVINRNIEQGFRVKVFEVENYICWGTPDDYETYQYWRRFFDGCSWHPYSIMLDSTRQVC